MPPVRSRLAPGKPTRVLRSTPSPLASRVAPPPSPAVRILVAGVDKDERGAVEAAVRQGLGPRAAAGPWSVSVVHLAGKWSVTVDGGGLRSASVVTERDTLTQAIRGLVDGGGGAAAAPGLAPKASPAEVRHRHACERCGQPMVVVYESQADEPKQLAPVACPHCWAVGHLEIGAWAAAGREYRSEKA